MIINLILLTILAICLITDIKERKIYNKVIFPGLVIGLIFHMLTGGLEGLLFYLIGFIVGFIILLIPYFMGGMGAGDVKLLALIGALKGATFVVTTAIYMAILGGLIGLILLLFRKGSLKRIKSIFYTAASFSNGLKIPFFIDKEGLKTTYPYGVAIVGGALISLLYKDWVILW